jgi:DNA-binding MarR family transcriptional regulator
MTFRFRKPRRTRQLGEDSGPFDEAKGKALLILDAYQQEYGWWSKDAFLTARDIHEETGVNLDTLYASLRRWWKTYRYVRRSTTRTIYGTVVYTYAISEKSVRWLNGFGRYLPLDRWRQEIEAHQRARQQEFRKKEIEREARLRELQEKLDAGLSPFTEEPRRHGTTKTEILYVLSQSRQRPLTAADCYVRTGVPVDTCMVALLRMSRDGLVQRVPDLEGSRVLCYQIALAGDQYLTWAKKNLPYRRIIRQIEEWQAEVHSVLARLSSESHRRITASALHEALKEEQDNVGNSGSGNSKSDRL